MAGEDVVSLLGSGLGFGCSLVACIGNSFPGLVSLVDELSPSCIFTVVVNLGWFISRCSCFCSCLDACILLLTRASSLKYLFSWCSWLLPVLGFRSSLGLSATLARYFLRFSLR